MHKVRRLFGRRLSLIAGLCFAAGQVIGAEIKPAVDPVDYELRVAERPIIQRVFMPDSSPRSIAVGLRGGLSYCFDAELCRLRYAWSGGFLNMKPTWHERGAAPPQLLGEKFFIESETMVFRLGDRAGTPKLKFLGYALAAGLPEFRFSVGGIMLTQRVEAARNGGLRSTFEAGESPQEIFFHAAKGVRVSAAGKIVTPDGEGWVRIPSGTPRRFGVLIPGPAAGAARTAAATTNER